VLNTFIALACGRSYTSSGIVTLSTAWAIVVLTLVPAPVVHTEAGPWVCIVHSSILDALLAVAALWSGTAVTEVVAFTGVSLAVSAGPISVTDTEPILITMSVEVTEVAVLG
jgi:hypothetical protein